MNPPPPRLPAEGQVTASARPTATAASTAFPPRFMTSAPTREAISDVDATIALRARAGGGQAAKSGNATASDRRNPVSRFMAVKCNETPLHRAFDARRFSASNESKTCDGCRPAEQPLPRDHECAAAHRP